MNVLSEHCINDLFSYKFIMGSDTWIQLIAYSPYNKCSCLFIVIVYVILSHALPTVHSVSYVQVKYEIHGVRNPYLLSFEEIYILLFKHYLKYQKQNSQAAVIAPKPLQCEV